MSVINIDENDGIVVIELSGEITMLTVNDIDNACRKYISSDIKILALDLRSVQFIDSYGISRLIKQLKAFTVADIEFALINMNDNTLQVFKIATFDRIFTILTKEEFNKIYITK